jgi:hypothetical protein
MTAECRGFKSCRARQIIISELADLILARWFLPVRCFPAGTFRVQSGVEGTRSRSEHGPRRTYDDVIEARDTRHRSWIIIPEEFCMPHNLFQVICIEEGIGTFTTLRVMICETDFISSDLGRASNDS